MSRKIKVIKVKKISMKAYQEAQRLGILVIFV